MLEIRYDNKKIKQLERELRGFPKNSLPKVMSRGLNRTATEARTKVSRMLSREIGLKVRDVRERVSLKRASYRNWRSAVTISRKRVPLIRFSARQTKKGVTYKRGNKRVLIRHAFVATMSSGHEGVFLRKRLGGTPRPGESTGILSPDDMVGRLPIQELRGPSLGQVYTGAQEKANAIHRESMQKLEKNINDQIRLILKRRLPA